MAPHLPRGEPQQTPALQVEGKARHCLGLQGGQNRALRTGEHLSHTPKATQKYHLTFCLT